jgi:hypothetical protein
MDLNKIIVANVATTEGDVFMNGRLVKSGTPNARFTNLYFFHEDETDADGETVTRAFAVPVEKPVTRAKAINAAEMEAYGLHDAMEVASFNAALARKWRENPQDAECIEHDQLIENIKEGLSAMGIK